MSFSTSSRSAPMCSRASRRVAESFSFCETAWASWPLVSSRRSSSVRTRFGASWRRRRRTTTSSSSAFSLLLKLADLAFVFSEASLVLGGHVTTSHCGRALDAAPYTRVLCAPGHFAGQKFTLRRLDKLTEYVWGHSLVGEPEVGNPPTQRHLTEHRGPRRGRHDEGLDRPRPLHRRRPLRRDRPGRVHAARRRPCLRQGRRQGLREPGRCRRVSPTCPAAWRKR